ncbi:MAG: hypothetical protein AB1696_19855 [Planctomycetota bacterium]
MTATRLTLVIAFVLALLAPICGLSQEKPETTATEWSAWGPGGGTITLAPLPDGWGKCLAWTFEAPVVEKPPRGLLRSGIRICEKDDPPGEWVLTLRVRGDRDLPKPLGLTLGDADKSSWRSTRCSLPVRKDAWTKIELPLRFFFYAWGNDQRDGTAINPAAIQSIVITVPHGLAGTVYVADVKFERKGDAPKCPTNYPLDFGKSPLNAFGREKDLPTYERPAVASIQLPPQMKPGQPSRVEIIEGGITIVNEQPFFPIGLFCVPKDHFGEIRRAGANTMMQYKGYFETRNGVKEYLDECMANGLMGVVDVQTYTKSSKTEKADIAGLTKLVNEAKDHPALLAYYIADEPEYGKVPPEEYVTAYKAIKSLDPFHPVIMLNNQKNAIKTYALAGDVLMPDPYPGFYQVLPPGFPLSGIADFMQEARDAKRAAVWITPQLHNGPCYHDERGEIFGRTPTLAEERFMTYSAVVHGARGFLYWCYGACRWDMRDTPKYAEAVKALLSELALMEGVFATGRESDTVHTADPIRLTAWMLADHLYVVAVNNSDAEVKAQITIDDAKWKELHVFSEERKVKIDGGVVADKFKPWDVHIYMSRTDLPPLPIAKLLREYVEPYSIAGTLSPVRERNTASYLNGALARASSTGRYARAMAVNNGGYGCAQWTPDPKSPEPHWIEIALPKARKLSRVVAVAPIDREGKSSLDDGAYQLQLSLAGGEWRNTTVEMKTHYILWNEKTDRWERSEEYVPGAAKAVTHTFLATDADRLRLLFDKGKRPSLVEIEAYE